MRLASNRVIDIIPPVRNVFVTQPFGVNYVGFYAKMGLKGHPGIDYRARHGCPIILAHNGEVSWCGEGKDGGVGIEFWNKENGYKTFYYHHKKNGDNVIKGSNFRQGEIIALADNTGKYTTSSHEHFELYLVDEYGRTLNSGNGTGGSIDPSPYFKKDWDKSRSYHRYGRKANYWAELKMRFKNPWLHRQLIKRGQLIKIYNNEFINALVYGGWALEDVLNPALYMDGWGWLKKDEFTRGVKPFG